MKTKAWILLLSLIMNFAVTGMVIMLYPFSRESNHSTEGYLFTFAHITDSQFSGSSAIFEKTTLWLTEQSNISFVVHTGDITNSPSDETTWKEAYRYMHQLDERADWAVAAGDNDVMHGSRVYLANYEKYFGNNSIDQYCTVEDKLLFILFSWTSADGSISEKRLQWMDGIIQNNEKLYVIVCLHPYLFGFLLLNYLRTPNADEIWSHIDKHDNVIMTLSGHTHQNWIDIHLNGKHRVWSISTEALAGKGYIRLFDVYKDKIEAHAYSPWRNETYTGTLDHFTIELKPGNYDVDADLWRDDLDMMPTHPGIPNAILISATTAIAIIAYWVREEKRRNHGSSTTAGTPPKE